ncbi:hypothetical protein ACQYD3_004436 [Enterobacter hormaechei]|uniref:hypothetical protein n=1 Tax=Enterobacter hormaechei TaxID=158836 RepID=UPI002075E20F|nr:hypothetical protein [Enterobacter hormaechei]EKK5497721.1 hypothetical protein [Enterobacter hormaechei]EKK5499197.1 hypothetical protein [Enterobacter hormaechei]MCM7607897.1 hypothetical protein [Enterobacter hormaechei]MDM1706299.1 hypothetical protein [Enterobacter hormaechei]
MTILLKILKWCAFAVVAVFILGWLFVWLVASGSDETTVYTQNDFFHYHTLTDKDIENAPRVTDDYYFEAHPGDGYAPSNSIFFKGATGAAPLRAYLETLGYTKEKRRLGDKEIWSKPDQVNGDLFYLYFNAATGEVELTKVMNY